MSDWVNLPFEEALAYLRGKKPTPRDVFDLMSLEAQDRAFTVSRISKLTTLQEVLDALKDGQTEGLTLSEFVDRFKSTGLDEAHLETVYRTNIQSAFGRGRYNELTDPATARAFWGWRYGTVGDSRVRETHAVLDGKTFATGAHDEVFPPWDFNCRCSAQPITNRQAREEGIESDSLPAEVQTALGETEFVSPAVMANQKPDVGGFDLGLISHYVNDHERRTP